MNTAPTAPTAPTARVALALTLLALTACDRPPEFDRPLAPSAAYALDRHAAWLLRGPPAVFTLDPATLTTARVELPHAPIAAFVAPDRHGLLVLDEAPAARWIPFDERGPLAPIELPLTARYGAAAFAPDGRRVVLHAGDAPTGAALVNPNQIALIDLDRATVTERTLRSFGDRPAALVVSPRADIAGAPRQLAWALSDRYLALFDLEAPTAREVIVHLTLANDTRTVAPRQIVIADAEAGLTAFIRADDADDIFALEFPTPAPADTVPRPVLNQLPAGVRPSDIAVVTLAQGPRVFAIEPALPGISVIDPITAERIPVSTGVRVGRILPFTAPRPEGGDGHFALAWRAGAQEVVFADLDHLAERRGRALTSLVLAGAIGDVHPIPGRRMAVATVATDQLVVIDFDARTATPLTLAQGLRQLIVDPDGSRIYLLTGDDVVALDVATLTAAVAPIPGGGDALLHLPAADRLLVADTGDPLGHVTALPETPTDGEAIERAPLFIEGVFDR